MSKQNSTMKNGTNFDGKKGDAAVVVRYWDSASGTAPYIQIDTGWVVRGNGKVRLTLTTSDEKKNLQREFSKVYSNGGDQVIHSDQIEGCIKELKEKMVNNMEDRLRRLKSEEPQRPRLIDDYEWSLNQGIEVIYTETGEGFFENHLMRLRRE